MTFNEAINLAYKASEHLNNQMGKVDNFLIERVEKKVFGKPLNKIVDPAVDKAINVSEKYIRIAVDKVSTAINERKSK